MALLQISEPGQSTNPHQHKLAAGIDLGTTNSLVAAVRSGVASTLADTEGEDLLPSVVRYQLGQTPVVGASAKKVEVADPLNIISSVKRYMGRSYEEIVGLDRQARYQFDTSNAKVPRIKTIAGNVTPMEVSAEILKTLKLRAELSLAGELVGVVITVPAHFDDAQRQATKDAAKLAGLNVLRLINEPTAAALAYGLDKKSEGIVAVYDLGGGTFDISILRLHKGVFEVMASGGDTALGGDDFDHALAGWMLDQAGVRGVSDKDMIGIERRAKVVACCAKEELTKRDCVNVTLPISSDKHWQAELTREQFNQIIEPLIKRTLLACKRVVRDANIDMAMIKEIVMVGGSTRVPLVRSMVGQMFSTDVMVDIDPDKVVALGAAIQANILVGNKSEDEMLLLDVVALSLGLETMGGLVEKVIHRNTTIPVAKAQDFTTYKDGQTAMSIKVLQGERELVSDCRVLAKFELRGIPPMVAGAARIRVTFQVDADGLLSVSAKEMTMGIESAVEVQPAYGLQDSEIESMLRDSMQYAQQDVTARSLREQQVEAERVIDALVIALEKDGKTLLSETEYNKLSAGVSHLRKIAKDDDHIAIKTAIAKLNKESTDFAARRMNASIQSAMTGHDIDEFK
ncbi:MAG: Fe-S protein assembly chaperone HscA [Thiohalomonadales bacterium]